MEIKRGCRGGVQPEKNRRPSHNYHTYLIGSLRVVLGVGVSPGKQHSAKCGTPGLWTIIDSCLPPLVRGSCAATADHCRR
jgi:hypothetical protein